MHGCAGRIRLVLCLALLVVAFDHAAKLGAAAIQPAHYLHNPSGLEYDWLMLLPFLAVLLPSRTGALLLGLWLGGSASNTVDVYLWPGGVPDFIPAGEAIWNPADFAIYCGGFGLAFTAVGWPTVALFRVARRDYSEPSAAETA